MELWCRVIAEAPVDAIMLHNHYCLTDTRGLELVTKCRAGKIGMISASPFASGLLTGGRIPDWHPADDGERRLFAAAARHCEGKGSSLAKLAFQFSSQDNPFHTTLFSSARTSSVQRNLEWFREPLDLEVYRSFVVDSPVLPAVLTFDFSTCRSS